MQHDSNTSGCSQGTLSDFLQGLLQHHLDRVLAANQPVEPAKKQMSEDAQALVLSCSESVKALAWSFARSSSRVDPDDMYSIGMLEICESVAAGRLANAENPIAYLCGAARFAMADEWRRLHRWSTESLDAPLSMSNDGSFTLLDILSAPASAAVAAATKQERALHTALGHLTARRRAVLRRRYGLPGYGFHTEKQTARSLHTSIDAVDIASRRGLRNLRADARLCEVVGVEVAR